MENSNPNIAKVQHVAKSSSDQLLRKFAEVGSDSETKISSKELRLAKRTKRSQGKKGSGDCNAKSSGNGSTGFAERKALLPSSASRRPMALIRRLGKARIKAREFTNKSFITAIDETWRLAVGKASRALMEKHYYNRHKRLINDSNW
ncbi:uncharacterized protein LOC127256737 [Andrographis paniculata]|uniref:uncharacterized protein LOC127256737 n=1 Tax=Andrographis paniculata TaxID=175694 RepID=UPI0021E9100A|nr:uncharacterized protein LOC127256737 [Andrographis paniculata]